MNKRQRGFTLIELIVTMTVISILATALAPMLLSGVELANVAYDTKGISSQGRVTLELMAQDIRNTKSGVSGANITTGANSLTVNTLTGKAISFNKNGTDLIRAVNGTNSTLANNITNLNFTYYTIGGTTTTAASLVRFVKLSFTMHQGVVSQTFTLIVALRNIE